MLPEVLREIYKGRDWDTPVPFNSRNLNLPNRWRMDSDEVYSAKRDTLYYDVAPGDLDLLHDFRLSQSAMPCQYGRGLG